MPGLFFDSGISKGFEKDLQRMNTQYNSFSSNVSSQNNFLESSFGKLALAVAGTFTVAKIVQFGKDSVGLYQQQTKALAQVEQGLISTGNAAGITFQELQKEASSLQKNTLFGDEDILQNATAQLLTFTNIADEQFLRTQKAALDLSTRLGGDLKSSAIQLGKALNDPVANLSALSRSGIQFTTEQKTLINSLVETNQLAEAQTIILDELEKQYGGSAEAAAEADGGITQLKNAIGDTQEVIGGLILEGMQPLVQELKSFFENLSEEDIREFIESVKDGAKIIGILITAITAWKLSMIATTKIMQIQKAVQGAMRLESVLAGGAITKTAQLTGAANKVMVTSFKALKAAIATNPIGLLITGLTIAIPLINELSDSTEELVNVQNDFTSIASTAQKSIIEQTTKLNDLLSVAQDETKSLRQRKSAIEELNRINPKYLGNIDLEAVKTGEAQKAIEKYSTALLRNAKIQAAKEKIIELEKERIDILTEGQGIEISNYDKLLNGLKNIGDAEGFIEAQRDTNHKERIKRADEIEKRVQKLAKLAGQSAETGLDFISPDRPPKPTPTGEDNKELLNYYQLLKIALKDAQLGLENLSGVQDDVNLGAIAQQRQIITNIRSQIEQQEKILGINQEESKEKEKERKAEKGSLQFLKDKLAIAKEEFEFATGDEKRAIAKEEIKNLEIRIELLNGIEKKEKDIKTLTLGQLLRKRKAIIEEKEGVDELTEKYKALNAEQEKVEGTIENITTEWLSDLSNGLGSMASSISRVNENIGQTLQEISEVASAVGSIVQGLASKNYIQAAAGVFDLAVRTIEKLNDNKSANESVLELIELQNKELEEQLKLLDKTRGVEVYTGLASAIRSIDTALQSTNDEIDKLIDSVNSVDESEGVSQIQALAEQNAAGGVEDITEALKKLQAQEKELTAQRSEILDKFYQQFTGTTSDAITDTITDGFVNAKEGIVDFAGTFEELMKGAMLESFNLQFLQSQFDEFYEEFGKAAQSGGGLTKAEIAQLRKEFTANITIAEQGFAQFDSLFKEVFGTGLATGTTEAEVPEIVVEKAEVPPVSSAGEIRQSITEETGTILAGRIGAMVLSNEIIANQGIDMLDYAIRNLQYQKAIKENTDYLPQIEQNTRKISELL